MFAHNRGPIKNIPTELPKKDSEPRVFITCKKEADAKFAEYVRHVVDTSTISKEAQKARPDYGIESVQPNDVACICYTSGTTGLPKGAMLTHGNLMWNAESLIDAWRFTSSDILLHYLPFYHVHGMFISLNCSLFTRSAIIFRFIYPLTVLPLQNIT
ncbi:unnamed protein product [Anisakis simplex]|uniref:AMP-binding domain-containing protein n=1 Tax=Anisakis simplex TaxID=6269 RepID=A0A0M3J7I4_ANISI|nr:unnamed protein product [Anisakis simplex]